MRNRKHETQYARILRFLQTGKNLTPLEALNLFGTLRLSAQIFVMRERGHDIKTEIVEVKTREGVAHVARYSMTQVSFLD